MLRPDEFFRRFLLHVLPSGFVKLRHFGLWASGGAKHKLALAQKLLADEAAAAADTQAPAAALAIEPTRSDARGEDPEEPEESETDQTEALAERILRLCGIDINQCLKCELGRMKRQPLPSTGTDRTESLPDTS